LYDLIQFTDEQQYIDMFLALPQTVYHGDKKYSKEKPAETTAWLLGQHPSTGFLKQKNLLVLRNGAPAARGIAFVNTLGNFGTIGFFDCLEDAQAVKVLADAAKVFCKAHGMDKIYAPMNGSIFASYRLMTKGFEDKPFLSEPYNKPYYHDVLVACGFRVAKTWETQFVDIRKNANKAQLAKSPRGITVRNFEDFDEDLRIVHKLVMNSFANFFLFHELDEETFASMLAKVKMVYNKHTSKIAYNSAGEPVGFGLALPDYQSIPGFLLKYAKRYVFLYLGTVQENGETVYLRAAHAIVAPILQHLHKKRKGLICGMMSEDAKTRYFATEYDRIHEYALLALEVD